MANENGARLRFRPAGSAARQHGAPEYGPLGTGCPAVEQAVTAPIDGMLFTRREYPVVYSGSLLGRILGGGKE